MNTRSSSAVIRCGWFVLVSMSASLFLVSGASAAACYDFKLLADTSTSFNRFLAIAPFVSLNNEGTAIFLAHEVGREFNVIYHVNGTTFPVKPAVLSSDLSPSVA